MTAIVRGLCISTNCRTVDEFIDRYSTRADRDSIFVGAPISSRLDAIVTECGFVFLLANKRPVLAGTCVVRTVFINANNLYRRAGLRLGITRLGPDSRKVFAALRSPIERACMSLHVSKEDLHEEREHGGREFVGASHARAVW